MVPTLMAGDDKDHSAAAKRLHKKVCYDRARHDPTHKPTTSLAQPAYPASPQPTRSPSLPSEPSKSIYPITTSAQSTILPDLAYRFPSPAYQQRRFL